MRVLITNDNGIDDPRIVALARAFVPVAETFVVASSNDRSGTSNAMVAARAGKFRVQRRDLGAGITAYAVDGTPADCVIFALTGPMKDAPPQLVISGMNGGPNLADDWFGSGTIGAARTAAYFGFPAIAVSGVPSDAESMQAAAQWVVELAQSPAVKGLRPPEYLTVSLPRVPFSQIKGTRVVRRARGLMRAVSQRAGEQQGWEEWAFSISTGASTEADTDVAAVLQNSIAIVPMQVNEDAPQLAGRLNGSAIPPWSAPAVAAAPCTPRFGAVIDDAEEASGREWGVLIESVIADGPAATAGFRPRDVIVAVNGESLAKNHGEPDPKAKLQAALQKLCGKQARFAVRRGTQDLAIMMAF